MVKVFMKNSKDDFILNFGDSSKGKAPVSQFQTRVARGERMKIEKRILVMIAVLLIFGTGIVGCNKMKCNDESVKQRAISKIIERDGNIISASLAELCMKGALQGRYGFETTGPAIDKIVKAMSTAEDVKLTDTITKYTNASSMSCKATMEVNGRWEVPVYYNVEKTDDGELRVSGGME